MLSHFSCVWLFETRWTVAHMAPLPMRFSRQEYWSELPCSPPGNLPDPRIKARLLGLLHWLPGSWPLTPPGKPKGTTITLKKKMDEPLLIIRSESTLWWNLICTELNSRMMKSGSGDIGHEIGLGGEQWLGRTGYCSAPWFWVLAILACLVCKNHQA